MGGDTPDYGIDGFAYMLSLLCGGAVALLASGALALWGEGTLSHLAAGSLGVLGALALLPGLLGLRYVVVGKFQHRDRLLSRIAWRGDERVLDLGTGGGLLAIAAAKRAPKGSALGIDIWDESDLSDNTAERARNNAALEGVGSRVEIRDEDARKLSAQADTFDVVVSMLCVHNIAGAAAQDAALAEAVRVLKPGGTLLLSDLSNTQRYAEVLGRLGLVDVVHTPAFLDTFPPQRVVQGRKR